MTPNMEATLQWIRDNGFMATEDQTIDLLVANRGREDGRCAGTWVIDGNTSDETCREILRMIDDCDPALELPELRLGEWADDPSFREILDDVTDIDWDSEALIDNGGEWMDDLFRTYSDAWHEGMQAEVERACLARIATPDVTQPTTKGGV